MIDCGRARDLRLRWLAGEAEGAREALAAHAAACPACGEALARQLTEDEALRAAPWAAAARAATATPGFAERVLARLPRTSAGRLVPPAPAPGERFLDAGREADRRRRRFLKVWGAAAAAAMLVAASVGWMGALMGSRIELAQVVAVSGEIRGRRVPWERFRALAPGDRLAVGSRLRTQGGLARLRFADGSLLDLGPGSELRLEGPRSAALESGRTWVSAAKAADAWILETPEGRVVTLGTIFSVTLAETETPATPRPPPATSPAEPGPGRQGGGTP